MNSWASLRFGNLSGILPLLIFRKLKKALFRVRHGLWSIRERCICWPFSSHIPFSIIEFQFHLAKKNLNFQHYNFLIGILDVCRIPRIYLNAKINFITSLRLLFYSESMRESPPYLKYSMGTVRLILTKLRWSYKDKQKRAKSWTEIGEQLVENYMDKSDKEKTEQEMWRLVCMYQRLFNDRHLRRSSKKRSVRIQPKQGLPRHS